MTEGTEGLKGVTEGSKMAKKDEFEPMTEGTEGTEGFVCKTYTRTSAQGHAPTRGMSSGADMGKMPSDPSVPSVATVVCDGRERPLWWVVLKSMDILADRFAGPPGLKKRLKDLIRESADVCRNGDPLAFGRHRGRDLAAATAILTDDREFVFEGVWLRSVADWVVRS